MDDPHEWGMQQFRRLNCFTWFTVTRETVPERELQFMDESNQLHNIMHITISNSSYPF